MISQGELEHRRVKRFYSRTNKFNFTSQIAKHQHRERILRNIRLRSKQVAADADTQTSSDIITKDAPQEKARTAAVSFEDSDPLPYTSPNVHYHISESKRHHEDITNWLGQNANLNDPTVKVGMFCLLLQIPLTISSNSISCRG
jgi:hypothetical protein